MMKFYFFLLGIPNILTDSLLSSLLSYENEDIDLILLKEKGGLNSLSLTEASTDFFIYLDPIWKKSKFKLASGIFFLRGYSSFSGLLVIYINYSSFKILKLSSSLADVCLFIFIVLKYLSIVVRDRTEDDHSISVLFHFEFERSCNY